jgi:glycine dehydrogenase subunit 1
MPYTPHTESEIREMLQTVGVESIDDLFRTIPKEIRVDDLGLPPSLSEHDVTEIMSGLAALNVPQSQYSSFLGGGIYDGLIPAAVDAISGRSEFLTAYTPYQAEVSQGTLQLIYEWQTFVARLTGLPVSNASMYDGATALVEGVLMALAKTRRKVLVVPEILNPRYRAVIDTHMAWEGVEIRTAAREKNGASSVSALRDVLDDSVGAVVIQNPGYLGCIEPVDELAAVAAEVGAMVVASVNPVSLSLLKSPGEYGAAVATGEAQPFGIAPSWGGPLLGFLSCSDKLKRQIPGRVVGRTSDDQGREGYVLTLQTREQHIRREKATSNICSNQGLNMCRATVTLAMLGTDGLVEMGHANRVRCEALRSALAAIDGVELPLSAPVFNEFVVRLPGDAQDFVDYARNEGLLAGIPLEGIAGCDAGDLLVAVTEKRSAAEIAFYAEVLGDYLDGGQA